MELGGRVLLHTRVAGFERRGRPHRRVAPAPTTCTGDGDAWSRRELVVNAAGAWAREIAGAGRDRRRHALLEGDLAHHRPAPRRSGSINRLRPASRRGHPGPRRHRVHPRDDLAAASIALDRIVPDRRRRATASSTRPRRMVPGARDHPLHPGLRRRAAARRAARVGGRPAGSAAASRCATTRPDGVDNFVIDHRRQADHLPADGREAPPTWSAERLGVDAPCLTRDVSRSRPVAANQWTAAGLCAARCGCRPTRPTTCCCASARWCRPAPWTR
ncbi:MAG: hypothetical protein MZU91_07730 [Desulfosudis oleivorans]|nr:hypothetical protein [Desulfosudis oleivorans]